MRTRRNALRRPLRRPIEYLDHEHTMTPAMAVRAAPGPFDAAPIFQGAMDGTGTPDVVTFPRGAQIVDNWYENFDPYQGSISFWITPEWDGDDGVRHHLLYGGIRASLTKTHLGWLSFQIYDGTGYRSMSVDVSAWAAGASHNLVVRYDTINTLDGTNYFAISVDGVHAFGATVVSATPTVDATYSIGSGASECPANALIEGLTIYRRPLYDGAYGIDVGNGDEIAQIYAAGAGKDPTEITGAWDVVACLPTDQTQGTLATTGQMWSMPHSSNVLTDGFAERDYAASAWADEGTPLALPGLEFNGTDSTCVIPDAAAIQDLHAGAMTVEAWVRADGYGENDEGRIFDKTVSSEDGWRIGVDSTYGLYVIIYTDTNNGIAACGLDEFLADGRLHQVCFQYDDGGDRTPRIWVDGIPVTSYVLQQAATGIVDSDVGNDLIHGNRSDSAYTFDGFLGGYARISNILRYTNGEAFVPNAPDNPPAVDGNTVWQTDYSDGAGAVLTDDSATGSDGALANHTWALSRDLDDFPGEAVFRGDGYLSGSDAADEGMKQTLAGLAAGENYVIRPVLSVSADSVARPEVVIRDETNGADITSLALRYSATHTGANNSATLIDAGARWPQSLIGATVYNITDGSSATITAISGDGTTITAALAGGTDDDWDTGDVYRIVWDDGYHNHPWSELFTFELPTIARNGVGADCVSISVKVINQTASGLVFVHQVELYENLIDNPSLETGAGNPWVPDGWAPLGLDPGDSTQGVVVHSGAASLRYNNGVSGIWELAYTVVSQGGYAASGGWVRTDGTSTITVPRSTDVAKTRLQARSGNLSAYVGDAWKHSSCVFRMSALDSLCFGLWPGVVTTYSLVDDAYAIPLDAVDLTVTPASEANSAESGGLRVDGNDALTTPVNNRLKLNSGTIWGPKFIPRHAPDTMLLFGYATPTLLDITFGATYLRVTATLANQLTLAFDDGGGAHTVNMDATGAWAVGDVCQLEVRYRGQFVMATLWVGGIAVATGTITTPVTFGAVLTANNWLSQGAVNMQQFDAVILEG